MLCIKENECTDRGSWRVSVLGFDGKTFLAIKKMDIIECIYVNGLSIFVYLYSYFLMLTSSLLWDFFVVFCFCFPLSMLLSNSILKERRKINYLSQFLAIYM